MTPDSLNGTVLNEINHNNWHELLRNHQTVWGMTTLSACVPSSLTIWGDRNWSNLISDWSQSQSFILALDYSIGWINHTADSFPFGAFLWLKRAHNSYKQAKTETILVVRDSIMRHKKINRWHNLTQFVMMLTPSLLAKLKEPTVIADCNVNL